MCMTEEFYSKRFNILFFRNDYTGSRMPDNLTTFGRATEGAHIAAVTLGLMGVEDGAHFLGPPRPMA